jgi:hypothetical protein
MAKSQADQLMGDTTSPETEEDLQVGAIWSDTVNIAPEKLSIPYLTLVQANSKAVANEQAKMGQWLLEGFDGLNTVTIVPLKFGESRRYSIEKDKQLVTACYAPTGGNHGIAKEPEGPGMLCADCPLSKWTPSDKIGADGKPKNNPPLCKESYDFVAFSMEHQLPVKLNFRSTGVKAGKLLALIAQAKGLGNFAAELSSKKETGNYVYAVPVVKVLTGEAADEAIQFGQAMFAVGSGS